MGKLGDVLAHPDEWTALVRSLVQEKHFALLICFVTAFN
jgi:hypothetical protein